jgi:periplasmic mercuric ion binding protein
MRRLLFIALLTAPLTAMAASPQTVVLEVQNMTCELCPITVKKALGNPDRANLAALVKATTDAGFPSSTHKGLRWRRSFSTPS